MNKDEAVGPLILINLFSNSCRPVMECETEAEADVNNGRSSIVFACMLYHFIGDSESSTLEYARQYTAAHILVDRIY